MQRAWTASERDAPRGWVIEGEGGGGGHARLTCTLKPNGGGRRFERELVYRTPAPDLRGSTCCSSAGA